MRSRLFGVGAFQRFDDLRFRLGLRQFSRDLVRIARAEILDAKRHLRAVLHRARIGRRFGDVGSAVHDLEGVERGHRVGKPGRGHGQSGFETGEGSRLHHFLVADLDDRRGLECLFVRDNVDGPQEPIALAGIDARLLRVRRLHRRGEFRRLGEIVLAVEVEIQRGADQGHAAEPGQRRAGEPSERGEAPLVAVEPIVAQSDRRLDSEVGSDRRCGRRGSPAAEKRPPGLSKQLFRSLLTPALSRTGDEISYRARPASASSPPQRHLFRPRRPLQFGCFLL